MSQKSLKPLDQDTGNLQNGNGNCKFFFDIFRMLNGNSQLHMNVNKPLCLFGNPRIILVFYRHIFLFRLVREL